MKALNRRLIIFLHGMGHAALPSGIAMRDTPGRERTVSAMFRTIAIALYALLVASVWASPAKAQTITVDPATAIQASSSSITMNHMVGTGTDRYLIVSVAIERRDATVSAVTYAGQALTFIGRITDANTSATLDVWGRTAPATGTNQVVVTLTNSAAVVVGAVSFANVSQATPIAASNFVSGTTGLTASGSVASATDQLVLALIAANDSVNSVTAGAGQTSRFNVLNAADVIGAASTRTGTASSTSMSYTFNAQGGWGMGLLALRASNPLIVTNTNDSGAGSLREAINAANANSGANTISFAISGTGPHTITLSSPLPALVGASDTIDGTTQPGSSCGDLWAGTPPTLQIRLNAGAIGTGLHLEAANLLVRGLSITGFTTKVFVHPSASNANIRCSYIGLLPDGTRGSGTTSGIVVQGAGTVIGGLAAGEGNVISGNSSGIMTASGSTNTAVRGNFIGTNPTGTSAIANGDGINHQNGAGTWRDITYNLISGNSGIGIRLDTDDSITPSTDTIRIQRNRIGFNRTLSALLANGGDGIFFDSGSVSNVLIGGVAASEGNEISGGNDAIDLRAVSNIRIRGNTIARAPARGIWLAGSTTITIGGTAAGEGNSIGGNGADGIFLGGNGSGITILGNLIQPITIAGATVANADHGIWIERTANVNVGDGTAAGRNIISGNRRRGIYGSTVNSNITINGNFIGTDVSGNVAVAGGQNFDAFRQDAIAFDDPAGSTTNLAILNNVIGGYSAALIEAWNTTINGLTIQGNSIGVGANGTAQITSGNIEELVSLGGNGAFSNVLIGGTGAGQGNIVAFGSRSGIRVDSTGSNLQVIGNTIRNNARNGIVVLGNTRAALVSNLIYANSLIGIDLGDNGVTANDAGDGDSGPNDLLNIPIINAVRADGTNRLIYNVALDAPAAASGYRIEFFANSAADPTGFGEGERYLGHVDITHAGGAQIYKGTLVTLQPLAIGDVISATTTRRTAGGAWDITSEFSAVATADGVASLAVAMSSAVFEPPADNPFATPGSDILLTTTVSNEGTGSTDADSVFVALTIAQAHAFRNAATPSFSGVIGFNSGSPNLTFSAASDLRFSNSATVPASLADCTYTPTGGYDPQVRHVCINPKGTLPSGASQGQFTVQMRARIN